MQLRVLSTTENQEAQELLDEIQQQPGVFVLSGPADATTNVVTASELLADGLSTESVSRVVIEAKTKQGNNGKERAEQSHYSYIQDKMTTFDTFPATVQGLDEGEKPTEKLEPEDDQDDDGTSIKPHIGTLTTPWWSHAPIRSGSRQTHLWCV